MSRNTLRLLIVLALGIWAMDAFAQMAPGHSQPEQPPASAPAHPGPLQPTDQPENPAPDPANTIDWGPRWGIWRAEIDLPEGHILSFNFVIDFNRSEAKEPLWSFQLRNGPEVIQGHIEVKLPEVILTFPGTDARIVAILDGPTTGFTGEYIYTRDSDDGEPVEYRLPFRAQCSDSRRFAWLDPEWSPAEPIAPRWTLHFDTREGPAIAELRTLPDGMNVLGTVITPTGDDGHLAGTFEKGRLRLSSFTGSSGILYDATLEADGTLIGTYRSLAHHAEGFTASPDGDAALPDPFKLTAWRQDIGLADLAFKTYDGTELNLAELAPDGSPRLIYIMGTWCHNCADATRYLSELHERYAPSGLTIVGLAFETPETFEEQAENVRAYVLHKSVPFPVLVAGQRDKDAATEALRALDRVRAFPTIAFVSKEGEILAVHQGFVGPAAPERHARLRAEFQSRIESMLD